MQNRHVVVITDCQCANAALRQSMAWVNFAGTDQPNNPFAITGDIDGAGMLVDALVESRGLPWVIFCQSAPRDYESQKKRNGSPFGYFWYRETLVIASLDGYMLSLAKRLGFITSAADVREMNIAEVLASRVTEGELTENEASMILRSQFRSLKFAPRAAGWILAGAKIPTRRLDFCRIPDFGNRVWWIDNFGNCKTSIRRSDVGYKEQNTLRTTIGELPCIYDLRSVPEGQQAATIGSSGPEGDEFIEFVVQGKNCGSAAKRFGLKVGSEFKVLDCD